MLSKFAVLFFAILLLVGVASALDPNVENIIHFDTGLPADADLHHLLSQPSIHKPFSYHQEFLADGSEDSPFSYNPKHELGPDNWVNYYPACGGQLQSPINIRTRDCIPHSFITPLTYPESHKQPTKVTIENNGYSVAWSFEYNGTRPHLTGGPLKSTYVLETIHMHWGAKGAGSEHAIDNEKSDLELHMIHRNVKYGTFDEATLHADGLVVIGLLSSASKNMESFDMFKNINDVRYPMSSVVLTGRPVGYIIKNLIGFMPHEPFITYLGSLTTPPCSEAALWMVSQRVRKISYEDMAQIRKLMQNNNELIAPNSRPIQKSYDRPCVMFKMGKQY